MISALLLAAALTTAAADKPPVARPKQSAKPAPKAKPKPPPPPVEEDDDLPDLDDPPEPDEPAPPPSTDDLDFGRGGSKADKDGPSEQDIQAVAGVLVCGCFCFVVAIVALIVFLLRKKPQQQGAAPRPAPGPAPAPAAAGVPFHLSVLALGLRAQARAATAQHLILSGVNADPTTAAERARLIREVAKSLLAQEADWAHFGYGERLDLPDETAAQNSYQLAVDDFVRRGNEGSMSGEATYVVATLVLCMRRQLRGVSALDDRAQIRALLDERGTLNEVELLGAFVSWSVPLGGYEVLTRYPEMHAVR